MLETISATLAGAALGFASSTPLGVINLWVADATLARTERRLFWFLAGVIACDALFAALAVWGYQALLDDQSITAWLELGGGLFLVFLGLRSAIKDPVILSKAKELPSASLSKSSFAALRMTALGATLCGSNPAFLMFWVVAVGALNEELGLTLTAMDVPALVIGVIIGDTLWFWLLTRLVRRGRDVLSPLVLERVRRGIGWLFVTLGVYIAIQGARALLAS